MVILAAVRPTGDSVRRHLTKHAPDFNYPAQHVGASHFGEGVPPAPLNGGKYAINRTQVQIGTGKDTYARAKRLLNRWGHFQLGWTFVPASTPIEKGERLCVCFNAVLLWALLPLRIVYVDDSTMPTRTHKAQFAFAHGTTKGHMLAGEERVALEHRADDTVWYDISSFSRPGGPLAVVTYPVIRFLQRKFALDSVKSVVEELKGAPEVLEVMRRKSRDGLAPTRPRPHVTVGSK
eukprot:jgi/Chlat1/1850/Chrsp141S02173